MAVRAVDGGCLGDCDATILKLGIPNGDGKLNWYLAALRKYAVFHGRARRKEYWYFLLFYVIFVWLAVFLDFVLGTFSMELEVGLLSGCFSIAMATPYIAVSIRRVHDTDRSGWWFLIQLIPIVGVIWFLVLDSLSRVVVYSQVASQAASWRPSQRRLIS